MKGGFRYFQIIDCEKWQERENSEGFPIVLQFFSLLLLPFKKAPELIKNSQTTMYIQLLLLIAGRILRSTGDSV